MNVTAVGWSSNVEVFQNINIGMNHVLWRYRDVFNAVTKAKKFLVSTP